MGGPTALAWATGVMLLTVRISMLFVATPLFGAIPVPAMAKAILVFGLAIAVAGSGTPQVASLDPFQLGAMVLHEAIVGGAIALGLFAGFAAWHLAGRLLDLQIGFGVASLVDIATKNNVPLLGSLLSMAAVVVFFGIDGHVVLLKTLQLSVEKLPPGTGMPELDFGALVAQFGTCFAFGFVVVAPIVLCLLLVDVGVAFMSRTMPQMNVFVLSLSLKVVIGLVLLAVIVPLFGGSMRRIFESTFAGWARLVG